MQQGQGGGPKVASSIEFNMASTFARKPVRTIEDGPTTKQKVIVSFIWIGSAFFGITTCFPDKVFGVELSQKIKEDQGGWMKGPQGSLKLVNCSPSLSTLSCLALHPH